MKQYVQDRFITVTGLILVALGYWFSTGYPDDSALFPKICLATIGVLLILITVESQLTKQKAIASNQDVPEVVDMQWRPFLLVTGVLALYALLVEILGFYVSSTMFLLVVGFGWGGVKRKIVLLFIACFFIFLFSCFTLLFNVPLPTGIAR